MTITTAQQTALDDLASKLDNLHTAEELDGTLLVGGDSADGPWVGHISEDGQTYWVVGGENDGEA